MSYAVGFSEHPVAAAAAGEAIGQVAESLAEPAETIIVFVTPALLGHMESIVGAVNAALQPTSMIGAGAVAVIANAREAEQSSALTIWATSNTGAHTVRIEAFQGPSGPVVNGLDQLTGAMGTLVLLSDPFSFPSEMVLSTLAETAPDLQIVGGAASAASTPGANRLALGTSVHGHGAVGLHFPELTSGTSLVSQGCRPIGSPFVVTSADRNRIVELGGQLAMERLQQVAQQASEHDRSLMRSTLQMGVVMNETQEEFTQGDFLIRGILGLNRDDGSVAISDLIEVGTTVQFQVRDPDSADAELRDLLAGRHAASVLAFSCNGRGQAMFAMPDHDAGVIEEELGSLPVAGMFCAGEYGPVASQNHVHGFTASLLLFQ